MILVIHEMIVHAKDPNSMDKTLCGNKINQDYVETIGSIKDSPNCFYCLRELENNLVQEKSHYARN